MAERDQCEQNPPTQGPPQIHLPNTGAQPGECWTDGGGRAGGQGDAGCASGGPYIITERFTTARDCFSIIPSGGVRGSKHATHSQTLRSPAAAGHWPDTQGPQRWKGTPGGAGEVSWGLTYHADRS